jgi:hypothetical protein
LPSAVYIRERLDYDPATGDILWRRCPKMPVQWNGRWAGKVAGTVSAGYRAICIDRVKHQSHRLAWLIVSGEWPTDQLDHINGDRSDNRFSNLREVCDAENRRNQARPSDNTSGHIGVYWHKRCGKWAAQIKVGPNRIHLGLFSDIADASVARKAAEFAHGFHPNHGRGPIAFPVV